MKQLLALLVVATPIGAIAQQNAQPSPTMNGPNWSTFQTAADSYSIQSAADTPTMARHKLARAIALRDEANVLRAADGGTLSDANRRYLQRKANEIRAGR